MMEGTMTAHCVQLRNRLCTSVAAARIEQLQLVVKWAPLNRWPCHISADAVCSDVAQQRDHECTNQVCTAECFWRTSLHRHSSNRPARGSTPHTS